MRMAGMSSIPCMAEQLSPRPESVTSTLTTTSKLRIHSLFHWRKVSNVSLRPSTQSSDHPMSGYLDSSIQVPRPRLSSRKGSERSVSSTYTRPRTAETQMTRKHDRMINDPPPLAQAYGQALLHAQVEVPTSFTEKPRYNSDSSKDGHSRALSGDHIEVKRSHKRTPSGDSTCSTLEKQFFLVNGPYVLQYNNESNGDAQPEKILVLDQDSVAIACDAVPGRPWVLRISKASTPANRPHGSTLRPSWSRMTLRTAEDRRVVNTMLLVFNDSEELYTWLFAVRKEIENLGGLEYRPDGEDDRTWRENLTRKFAGEADPQLKTLRQPTLTSPYSSRRRQDAANRSRFRTHSTQSSTSSKQTSTSLDRLRDSVASDACASTLATSCADGSASSTSPIVDVFPNIKSITGNPSGDLSLRSYARDGDGSGTIDTSPKASKSLFERRKLSVTSLNLSDSEHGKEKGRKYLPDLPSTISASPIETPPPVSKETNHVSPYIKTERRTDKPTRPSTRSESTEGSMGSVPRAKYSLFPACPPPESKNDILISPPVLSKPLPIPAIVEPHSDLRLRSPPQSEARHGRSKSRTVILELRQHRKSALLGAGDFMQPQRSPAVTDEMIMCNFGVAYDESPASPMPEIRVPGLSDLALDLDFLKMPYRAPSAKRNPMPSNRPSSSTRSVSSSRHERSPSLAKAPAGPPPTGPLPEVPSHIRQPSQVNKLGYSSIKSQDIKGDEPNMLHSQLRNVELPSAASLYDMLGSVGGGKDKAAKVPDGKEASSKNRARSRSRGRRKSAKG